MRVFQAYFTELFIGWAKHVRRARWIYAGAISLLCAISVYSVPRDDGWVARISKDQHVHLELARRVSHWGDFRGTFLVAMMIGVIGLVFRQVHLKKTAVAILLAAAAAGTLANVGRVIVGRPRPVSPLPDGWYGPTFEYKKHSFPSAHASTAAATATTVLTAIPGAGAPVIGAALAVIWSRIYLRAHHPTDVMFGAFLGSFFGLGLGLATRRRQAGS